MSPGASPRFRICFAGTADFAVPSLEAILAQGQDEIVMVLTQPDRPAGRGRALSPSPVKKVALDHGLPLYQPETLRQEESLAPLLATAFDVLVVAAYGLLLPERLLSAPRLLPVNVHGSLLPRWRGAAPIEAAILHGDLETGVTLMRVVPALDAGAILAMQRVPMTGTETGGSLRASLATLGAEMLLALLDRLAAGPLNEIPQNEACQTYAKKIHKGCETLDWSEPAVALERRIRAFLPRPGARALLPGGACKVQAAKPLPATPQAPPGTVVAATAEGIQIATGEGILALLALQPPGKRSLTAREFLNGHAHLLHPPP
jgi:methionyl-tRNA formyltransferase